MSAEQPRHRAALTRRDIMVFEQRLKEAVGGIFPFKGHSILFPRETAGDAAVWAASEKKLLLPLPDEEGSILGVFMARGVEQSGVKALLPHWPPLSRIITDNLLLYKRSLCDPVTGLFTRHYLLQCLERELDLLREPLRAAAPGLAQTSPQKGAPGGRPSLGEGLFAGGGEPRHGSVGILALRLAALRDVVREFGYQFADTLMAALADALLRHCPEAALAARTGDSEFAVELPSTTPKAVRALAAELAAAVRAVTLEHPLRRERVGISASVGYALYPQDMPGEQFMRPVPEQARLLLRKARLAAALAEDSGNGNASTVMGFGRILAEGGRVLEILPLSRVVVSLGASMHAREGQRFSVWSERYPVQSASQNADGPLSPLYKGELVLLDVREHSSQAEILHLGDPAWSMEPGDRLTLLPDEQGGLARSGQKASQQDPATGLLRHGDFITRWAEERERCDTFSLALLRLSPRAEGDAASAFPGGAEDASGDAPAAHPGRFVAEAAQLCCEDLGADTLGGRYGLNSLVFFLPGMDGAAAAERWQTLARSLEDRLNLHVAVGIAAHPCLDFRKSDALENCRKALEYAMLLPWPHVGLLDTLALNISADKRFSQGDTFGAIKEYQIALLADENNGLAWNSLGICLASLGRHGEALRHFTRALACNAADAMALYNLGYVHQLEGHNEEARVSYEKCLAEAPDHLFALIRLGQLAEHSGNRDEARALYARAAEQPGGAGLTCRHFARLCLSEGKSDEAREHLHEALLHDPQDFLAMHMLAGLYLDAGEDPDMAASLARQSVSLRPGLKPGWLELARALEAQGKSGQAREARLKAGEL